MRSRNTFRFCVDSQPFTKKPSNDPLPYEVWGKPDTEILQITRRIAATAKDVTIDELILAIEEGKTICPYIHGIPIGWDKPRRREEFFIGMSAVIIDFDYNVENIESIVLQLQSINLDFSIIHRSFSWTEDNPKYRGIILFNRMVTDPIVAKSINFFFKDFFQGKSDPVCADLSRIFFGGGKDSVVYRSSFICNEEDLKIMYKEFIPQVKSKVKARPNVNSGYVYDKNSEVSLEFMQQSFDKIPKETRDLIVYKITLELESIKKYSGKYSNRYMVLFNASRILGQIPVLPGNLIHDWILEAVSKNKHYNDYDKDINYIIESGIVFGKENESHEVYI